VNLSRDESSSLSAHAIMLILIKRPKKKAAKIEKNFFIIKYNVLCCPSPTQLLKKRKCGDN
jgi:hypothetical protein